jgi:hypothetical protein
LETVITGRRLGVYHVQERIGAGGMGEVYRARAWGSTGYGSATVTGMFLVNLYETTGDIWMTTVTRSSPDR